MNNVGLPLGFVLIPVIGTSLNGLVNRIQNRGRRPPAALKHLIPLQQRDRRAASLTRTSTENAHTLGRTNCSQARHVRGQWAGITFGRIFVHSPIRPSPAGRDAQNGSRRHGRASRSPALTPPQTALGHARVETLRGRLRSTDSLCRATVAGARDYIRPAVPAETDRP